MEKNIITEYQKNTIFIATPCQNELTLGYVQSLMNINFKCYLNLMSV